MFHIASIDQFGHGANLNVKKASRYLWVGVIFFAAFITLGVAVHSGPTSFDLTVARFFAAHRTHSEVSVARLIGAVAEPWVVGLLAISIFGIRIYRKRLRPVGDFVPIAMIASVALCASLGKLFFGRARPDATLATFRIAEPSFPSSHTAFMAAAGCAFLFIVVRHRLLAVSAIWVATAFVGLDRLVLGVHWFTDLVGSVLLSWGLFFLFTSLSQSLKRGVS